jgi:hypothetical protein
MSIVALADNPVGSLKQWPFGTRHGLACGPLWTHLDEFVFRHKRRPVAAMTIVPDFRPFASFGVRAQLRGPSRNLQRRSRTRVALAESRPSYTGSQCRAARVGSCPTAESVTARSSRMSMVICVTRAYYEVRTKGLEKGTPQTPNSWEAPRVTSVARLSNRETRSRPASAARPFGEGTRHGWSRGEAHFPFDPQLVYVPARSDEGVNAAAFWSLFL